VNENRFIDRQHPLFSPVALVATILLLVGLAVALYFTGGRAFSPGDLSAVSSSAPLDGFESHAAFGDDCTRCHTYAEGVSDARCLDCHTAIVEQEAAEQTLHAAFQAQSCTACHSEHKGSAHDLAAAAVANFTVRQHAAVYTLEGKHAQAPCADCHGDGQYQGLSTACEACHAEPEEHAGLYGLSCVNCHETAGWENAAMAAHAFPIDHAIGGEVPCVACHEQETYTAYSCTGCHEHAVDTMAAVHTSLVLTSPDLNDCAACHRSGTPDETVRLRLEQRAFEDQG
jgi:predicted CXXCH cytochrome family protein